MNKKYSMLIDFLVIMRIESEKIAKDFDRNEGELYASKDSIQQAIASISSKQSAMCTILIDVLNGME